MLVHKIDRLARNVADHAMIQIVLRRSGVRLASVVENLDDSVSGHLVEHVMAAIAEFHSSNLSEETKKGMRLRKTDA
jgi:site-specific DNA recombinase